MKLTLFDPSLTTKNEQQRNVLTVMQDLNDAIEACPRWDCSRQHAAILEYCRLFQNAVKSLTAKVVWADVFTPEVIERFAELATEIEDAKPKQSTPSNEFSSLGMIP